MSAMPENPANIVLNIMALIFSLVVSLIVYVVYVLIVCIGLRIVG